MIGLLLLGLMLILVPIAHVAVQSTLPIPKIAPFWAIAVSILSGSALVIGAMINLIKQALS